MARSYGISAGIAALVVVVAFSATSVSGAPASQASGAPDVGGASSFDDAPYFDPEVTPFPDGAQGVWQEEVQALVGELAAEYPEDFGYGAIIQPGLAEVHFSVDVPDGLAQLEGVSYVGALGYSEQQAHAFALSAYDAAVRLASEDATIAMQYLATEGRVRIFSDRHLDGSALAAAATTEARGTASTALEVEFEHVPDLESDQGEALDAGAVLRRPSDGTVVCTSAFSVAASQGRQGVLSAGHCPTSVHYWKPGWAILATTSTSEYRWVSSGQGEPGGLGGDARWYWSNTAFTGRTYVGTSYRRFASASNAIAGSQVCRYGATTGYSCGTVRTTLATISIGIGDGATINVHPVTCITTHNSSFGDSGGPWFFNYTGYGVHSGGSASLGSCFTPLPRILGRFDLSLLS